MPRDTTIDERALDWAYSNGRRGRVQVGSLPRPRVEHVTIRAVADCATARSSRALLRRYMRRRASGFLAESRDDVAASGPI